jgi:hypothetical protein
LLSVFKSFRIARWTENESLDVRPREHRRRVGGIAEAQTFRGGGETTHNIERRGRRSISGCAEKLQKSRDIVSLPRDAEQPQTRLGIFWAASGWPRMTPQSIIT